MSGLSSPLVLNVNEREPARSLLGRHLERAGFRVIPAATGAEALALARARRPDALVLDGPLPDLSAEQLARALRASAPAAPALFVDASARRGDVAARVEALGAGADACLSHPLEPAELVATLRALLRRSRAAGAGGGDGAGPSGRARAAFEAIHDPLFVVDAAGLVVECNRAGLALLGRDAERVVGRPYDEVAALALGPLDRLAGAARRGEGLAREVPAAGRWWRASAAALGGPGGEAAGTAIALADVTPQRHARDELARRLGAAEAEGRSKDEFLATLSHEMRTPLNAVLGWLHLVQTGAVDEAGRERALETIARNARQQARLIDDVLDVARIVAGKLTLRPGELRFDELVRAAVESSRPDAEAKGVALGVRVEGDLRPLVGDAERLQQVVGNLVSNAVKFSRPGGRVDLTLRPDGDRAVLTVRDEGAGISPDFLPDVFDRFRQQEGSPTREHRGLGLGLALVRHFVELHGGDVRAESGGAGLGATFTVRLPWAAAYDAASAPTPPGPVSRPGARGRPGDALRGLRVLVVDDDPDGRELVARVLEAKGAAVTVAATAADALAAVAASPPDVLVSDIGMPGEDGLSLVRKVRAMGYASPALAAVALTGFARREDGRRALEAGFDCHLPKPVEPDALASAVLAARGDERPSSA